MTENATADRLRELAQVGYDSMVSDTRPDGSDYIRKSDDCPGWVAAIIQDAHGGMFPDDFRYDVIHSAFGHIADSTADDLDDAHNFADSTTDVYNADLLKWVGSNLTRSGYVDDARDDLGEPDDFFHGLQMGQYQERAEIYAAVLQGLREVDTEYDEQEDAENS